MMETEMKQDPPFPQGAAQGEWGIEEFGYYGN
jgi:hypothetical protein